MISYICNTFISMIIMILRLSLSLMSFVNLLSVTIKKVLI